MKVYLDIFFLINFLMDFMILTIHRLIRTRKHSFRRTTIAALMGGISSVVILIFPLKKVVVLYVLTYIVVCALIIFISYGCRPWRVFVKDMILFYFISFVFEGAIRIMPGGKSIIHLIIYAVLIEIFLVFAIPALTRYQTQLRNTCAVKIMNHGNVSETTAFYDTGNQLFEPISGQKVYIIDKLLAKKVLTKNEYLVLSSFVESHDIEISTRVVPYHSMGTKRGLLKGIQVDAIYTYDNDRWIEDKSRWICISPIELSSNEGYQMLLHGKENN